MADQEQVAKLREWPEAWNRWRKEHPEIVPDLSEADLRGVNLRLANLSRVNLSRANLSWANVNEANLSGADLHQVYLLETILSNTNLREARGLDTCRHSGPSTLDHRTIAMSGSLPLGFLRGCGLTDWQIEATKLNFENLSNQQVDEIVYQIATLRLGQPVQFYSCFISYSSIDQEFAQRLYADLQNEGVRCWFAPHSIQGGKKLHDQIDEAIRVYDRLLLILSEHSMSSEWVNTEIANARRKEREKGRRVLFPILLVSFETVRDWRCFDADTGKDSAREIREYFIPDFSNWKDHDAYMQAFERLLRDLRTEEASQESTGAN
jgi:hypothetical protein